MTYATYCFLIDTRELAEAESSLDLLTSPDGDFFGPVNGLFEPWRRQVLTPAGRYWHTHEALMLHNGRVVQFVEEGDWRGRDEIVHAWRNDETAVSTLVSMTHDDPWAWLHKVFLYATRCAYDRVYRNLARVPNEQQTDADQKSLSELTGFMNNELPDTISNLYRGGDDAGGIASYRLNLVEAYEAYRSSIVHPFSRRICKPELYRCFDLRGSPEDDAPPGSMAVLLTDVRIPD